MKFLLALTAAGAVSPLVIGSINAARSPNLRSTDLLLASTADENIEQPHPNLAKTSDNHESKTGLEKRVLEEIPIPQGVADPASILKLGIVITIKFSNGGNQRKVLTVTSGLFTYLENQPVPAHKVIGRI
ncbi:hypothetical protein FCIRC_7060 [Fusarium circinatum]|uniref:Uncharacterized protein n=1 Tax=Fusarium circinatum TaxID=48490 RepID=A0A8H5WY89_FUSCI|nr:hypothetical protein FCIRC_7060 [Fusarium circinatum]